MKFGAIVIGDEILSGKRQDKHFPKLIELLAARGLQLDWAQYLGDDPRLITSTLARTLATDDVVFSFGGIGATPDDHTRECAARAAGVALRLHPDAEAEIRARFGDEITPRRLMMGEFPLGSRIIPNPYNRIPGFTLGRHHFVPGFPQMAWPMVEWVLETNYREAFAPGPVHVVRRGSGPVVLALGPTLDAALAAGTAHDATVLYTTRVRPLDVAGLRAAMDEAGTADVAVVEPWLAGTVGRQVSEALADRPHRLLSLGVPRTEHRHYGRPREHVVAHGLDAAGLTRSLGHWLL